MTPADVIYTHFHVCGSLLFRHALIAHQAVYSVNFTEIRPVCRVQDDARLAGWNFQPGTPKELVDFLELLEAMKSAWKAKFTR